MKIGFDHEQYTRMQSERIIQRIDEFGGKLYLELGGKLFDDYHASRVLPGFKPDSKVQMLLKLKDKEQGPRRPWHHLRPGHSPPDRRVPRHRPVCGFGCAHPLGRPAGRHRLRAAA